MKVFKLLGSILDRIAFYEGSDWSRWSESNNTFVSFDLFSYNEDIKTEAERLLDVDDSISNQNYNSITFVFDELTNCITEIRFGEESHNVKETIDNFVDCYDSRDIYNGICSKIVHLQW